MDSPGDNPQLVSDYILRARYILKALDTLYQITDYADVVRFSQETVELALKSLLRSAGIEPPRIHDVGELLLKRGSELPAPIQPDLQRLADISRDMAQARLSAYYGSEHVTPLGFYDRTRAETAMANASFAVQCVERALGHERIVDPRVERGPKKGGPGL